MQNTTSTVKLTVVNVTPMSSPKNHKINVPEFDIKIAVIIPAGLCFVFTILFIMTSYICVQLYKKQQTNCVFEDSIERNVENDNVSVEQKLQYRSKTA